MRYLRRFLIILASAAVFVAVRAVGGNWLEDFIESRLWKHSGELSELLISVVLVLVIAIVPRLREEMAVSLKGSWLVFIVAVFPVLNLVFFAMPRPDPGWLPLASRAVGGFAVGINEEIFLRGFAFARGGESTPRFTVVFTALTFGFLHLLNLTTGADPGEVAGTILLAIQIGLIYGVIRIATGGIFWCAILHGATDATFAFTDSDAEGYQTLGLLAVFAAFLSGVFLVFRHPDMRRKSPLPEEPLQPDTRISNPTLP